MIDLLVRADDPSNVFFIPEQHGFFFKEAYPLYQLEVKEEESKKVIWRIVATKVLTDGSTEDLPQPEQIKYGETPKGFTEQIGAAPLMQTSYVVIIHGPGYAGSAKFQPGRT